MCTAKDILVSYFGYQEFRSKQEEIITSILQGRDTLALLPTGGGKSLCFQIPTLLWAEQNEAHRGLCLVITPLIALMKDQVEHLKARNILATAIYTGMSADDQRVAMDNCKYGPYRFLYISPERLESETFLESLALLPICLIAIDEAHCISEWGYDFRPSYLKLARVREKLHGVGARFTMHDARTMHNEVPIIALTATATPEVVEDIQEKLGFREKNVVKSSFQRANLNYVVRRCPQEHRGEMIVHILSRVQGSSIVYVRNRKKTQEVAQYLVSQGIAADFYHAGLRTDVRHLKQQEWQNGTRCMVCTNAFGMGIDKPDVRVVIHYDMPDSLEAYYQEAGRAGRDGQTAYAVLLYDEGDKTKARHRVADTYPPIETVSDVYQKLCDYLNIGAGSGEGNYYLLDTDEMIQTMHLPPVMTYSALQLLTGAGYMDFAPQQDIQPRVQIRVPRRDLGQYELNEKQMQVLEKLMRHYTGIFTELQYLHGGDEDHEVMVSLAKRHVIHYVPRQVSDTLRMTQDRQMDIFLPKHCYEDRRAVYIEKMKTMIEYAQNEDLCREQVLVGYFGQMDAAPCGVCDVCRKRTLHH